MKQENSQFMDQIGKLDSDIQKISEDIIDSNEIRLSTYFNNPYDV